MQVEHLESFIVKYFQNIENLESFIVKYFQNIKNLESFFVKYFQSAKHLESSMVKYFKVLVSLGIKIYFWKIISSGRSSFIKLNFSCKAQFGGRTCEECSDGHFNYPNCASKLK